MLPKKAVVNRTARVLKYSGLSEDVIGEVSWKVEVINGSLVGCVCHVLVERCWSQDQGQGLQTQSEVK